MQEDVNNIVDYLNYSEPWDFLSHDGREKLETYLSVETVNDVVDIPLDDAIAFFLVFSRESQVFTQKAERMIHQLAVIAPAQVNQEIGYI